MNVIGPETSWILFPVWSSTHPPNTSTSTSDAPAAGWRSVTVDHCSTSPSIFHSDFNFLIHTGVQIHSFITSGYIITANNLIYRDLYSVSSLLFHPSLPVLLFLIPPLPFTLHILRRKEGWKVKLSKRSEPNRTDFPAGGFYHTYVHRRGSSGFLRQWCCCPSRWHSLPRNGIPRFPQPTSAASAILQEKIFPVKADFFARNCLAEIQWKCFYYVQWILSLLRVLLPIFSRYFVFINQDTVSLSLHSLEKQNNLSNVTVERFVLGLRKLN